MNENGKNIWLKHLPEHEPPFGLWTRIEHGLVRRKALRIGFIASGIAAKLLQAFVMRELLLPESMNSRPSGLLTIEVPAHIAPQIKMNTLPAANSRQALIAFAIHSLQMKPTALNSEVRLTRLPVTALAVHSSQMKRKDTLSARLLERNLKNTLPPPPAHAITNQSKAMSVGLNYIPEPSIKSENGSSALQTFALMAQYQLPSIDLQAEIGISGKERSSFLYYTIGAGKRIYSYKRFSTKLQVGGGVSFLLNNQPRASGPLYDALSKHSNTFFGKTESNIPAINRTHFDLFTGFNFSYRRYTRWSLSIEPTLKYFFNPIFNSANSRSFSTGLRTGILFKL